MSETADNQPAFVPVYSPADQSKLMMAEMILDREGVNYYVENELGALGSPAVVGALQTRVMVQADRADERRRLLQEKLGL
jgi:hypothetical protein